MAKILIRFKGADKAIPVEEADAMVYIENGEAVIVSLNKECAAVSPPEIAMKQRPIRKVRS